MIHRMAEFLRQAFYTERIIAAARVSQSINPSIRAAASHGQAVGGTLIASLGLCVSLFPLRFSKNLKKAWPRCNFGSNRAWSRSQRTRGGVPTLLNEIASRSRTGMPHEESSILLGQKRSLSQQPSF
jgi:hypothetical protein